jgi:DNA polymerase III delta subunit
MEGPIHLGPGYRGAMKPVLAVTGPRDAGPGERHEMLRRANALLDQWKVEGTERFDVPGRGSGEEAEGGALRPALEALVPALQSGSLFGGLRGVLIVDAHHLLKAEAEIIADLTTAVDGGSSVVVFVSEGALPAPLSGAVKERGETVTVKKLRERDAADWLGNEARGRGIKMEPEAAAGLLARFGSDIASMAAALDQLETIDGPVTVADVTARFRNRPDEPMWHYSDAVASGDVGEALRRLADFLTHGHPLQLLAFMEHDLRRRSLAAAAPDIDTLATWTGSRSDHYPTVKAWRQRDRVPDDRLRRSLDALSRADLELKTAPEETHRVTLERLTVALARWYGARGAG